MICANCAEKLEESWGSAAGPAICTTCGSSPLLDDRYRLEEVLGQGGSGTTYRATRIVDEHECCVKELSYGRLVSYEEEQRFHREASVLRQLDHPAIPDYLDDFCAGSGRRLSLYIVQELVAGLTLAQEMENRRYREEDVLEIAKELFSILTYLHELSPPVVHRDIKPGNVMRSKSDGRLVLIDFGSVKDRLGDPTQGATVAGTFGYMAPESFYGKTDPRADLYSVGVLLTVLLSRRAPAEMLGAGEKLCWSDFIQVSARTERLIDELLQRDPERRLASARKGARATAEASSALERERLEPTSADPAKANLSDAMTPVEEPARWSWPAEQSHSVKDLLHERQPTAAKSEPVTGLGEPAGRRSPSTHALVDDLVQYESPGTQSAVEKSSGAPYWIIPLLMLLVGFVAVMAIDTTPSNWVEESVALQESSFCGNSCSPLPTGLVGLELGMSIQAATAEYPTLADSDSLNSMAYPYVLFGQSTVGPQFRIRTELHGELATCQLSFAVEEERLSRIECQLDRFSVRESLLEKETSIVDELRSVYGAEEQFGQRTTSNRYHEMTWMTSGRDEQYTWSDEEVVLELVSKQSLALRTELSLSLTSRAHERAIERHAAEERRLQDERRRIEAAEAEERRSRELELIRTRHERPN